MKKTAPDYIEKANLRAKLDNKQRKNESGYPRNRKKVTKRLKIKAQEIDVAEILEEE